MADTPGTLGEGLRRERERRGLTQQEVADLLGTSQQSYHRWESGSGLPRDREHFRRIAQHLGLPVLDVLTLAFVPEEDVPSYEIERRIADVEARIATMEREDPASGNGAVTQDVANDALTTNTANDAMFARVQRIEAMVEQIGGSDGRLTQLEDMVREVRAAQARLAVLEDQLYELLELANRLARDPRVFDSPR